MWRTVVLAGLAGLAGCGMALAGPNPDYRQPQSLDDLARGKRFQLASTVGKAPELDAAPPIDFTLALELDSTWPGHRLSLSPHFPITREFEDGGPRGAHTPPPRRRSRSRGEA